MFSLRPLLTSPPATQPIESLEGWWQRHEAIATSERHPMDQAIVAGFSADRVGYAFASGYQAALHALLPDLPRDRMVCLCVTERGGGHPRAIESRLEADGTGRYRLTGKKRWAMQSPGESLLLVLASTGNGDDGRPRLRLSRVASTLPGVTRAPMAEPPFAPEIGHDEIELSDVRVTETDLCPGDGFDRYVRPFRTVEDLHVYAAILAYLLREVRLHGLPRSLAERLVALLMGLHALAATDRDAPDTHVALAGLLDLASPVLDEIDASWGKTESASYTRWARDRVLLAVAGSARAKRVARAWERLGPVGAQDRPETS